MCVGKMSGACERGLRVLKSPTGMHACMHGVKGELDGWMGGKRVVYVHGSFGLGVR